MKKSLSDDLRSWSKEEIKEAILNDTLSEAQKEQARDLLPRFSPLPKRIKNQLEDDLKEIPKDDIFKKCQLISEAYTKADQLTEKEFKEALKTIKHRLKRDGLILPRNWNEVFIKWYLKKQGMEAYLESIFDLPVNDRKLIFEWAEEYSKDFEHRTEEQSEKLKNLNHKLCLLDDLGILDLIENRFSDTHYKGKARETDKARLIASMFEIENPENVRQALKNNDYSSKIAKFRAVQTLINHGLEPKKFTD